MNHPFAMSLSDLTDLEFNVEIDLTAEEAGQVGGGLSVVTKMLNETGGRCGTPIPICKPPIPICEIPIKYPPIKCPPIKYPIHPCPLPKPPIMTTMAIGEEGGGGYCLM